MLMAKKKIPRNQAGKSPQIFFSLLFGKCQPATEIIVGGRGGVFSRISELVLVARWEQEVRVAQRACRERSGGALAGFDQQPAHLRRLVSQAPSPGN